MLLNVLSFPSSSPCEIFMENGKQWITYVIIADPEAGCLEIRTAQRQRKKWM